MTQGSTNVTVEPRATARLPHLNQLDVSFRKSFRSGARVLSPRIDLYNLANSATVSSRTTVLGAGYGTVNAIQRGRLIKFGLGRLLPERRNHDYESIDPVCGPRFCWGPCTRGGKNPTMLGHPGLSAGETPMARVVRGALRPLHGADGTASLVCRFSSGKSVRDDDNQLRTVSRTASTGGMPSSSRRRGPAGIVASRQYETIDRGS